MAHFFAEGQQFRFSAYFLGVVLYLFSLNKYDLFIYCFKEKILFIILFGKYYEIIAIIDN